MTTYAEATYWTLRQMWFSMSTKVWRQRKNDKSHLKKSTNPKSSQGTSYLLPNLIITKLLKVDRFLISCMKFNIFCKKLGICKLARPQFEFVVGAYYWNSTYWVQLELFCRKAGAKMESKNVLKLKLEFQATFGCPKVVADAQKYCCVLYVRVCSKSCCGCPKVSSKVPDVRPKKQ